MRCKQGDLAVIVAPRHKENIGALVEVLRLDGGTGGAPLWLVRSLGRPLLRGRRIHSRDMFGRIHDAGLRPIRPDPIPETVTDDIEVPE